MNKFFLLTVRSYSTCIFNNKFLNKSVYWSKQIFAVDKAIVFMLETWPNTLLTMCVHLYHYRYSCAIWPKHNLISRSMPLLHFVSYCSNTIPLITFDNQVINRDWSKLGNLKLHTNEIPSQYHMPIETESHQCRQATNFSEFFLTKTNRLKIIELILSESS